MIHIFEKYHMKTDAHCFIVGELANNNTLKNERYYSTFESALKGTYKRVIREGLQGVAGELKDAVAACQSLSDAFAKAVEQATMQELR